MIRVLENYASVKTLDIPVGVANLPIGTIPEAGVYTISLAYVVHSGTVEKDGFLLRGKSSVAKIPPSEGRISFTFELGAENVGVNLSLYSNNLAVPALNNHVTFHNIHIARGTQGADIWTPAHAGMTPEQIALMKYGEYKEIKAF